MRVWWALLQYFVAGHSQTDGGGRIEEQSKRKGNYTSITEYKGILWLSGHWRDKSQGIASWSGEWFYCEDRKSAVCSQGKSGSMAVKTTVYLIYMRTYRV